MGLDRPPGESLAARIAAGTLQKGDDPESIRRTFEAAGWDEHEAQHHVLRHQQIRSAQALVQKSIEAEPKLQALSERKAKLDAEWVATCRRHEAEMRELTLEHSTVMGTVHMRISAERQLRDLLPPYAKRRLAELKEALKSTASRRYEIEQAIRDVQQPLEPDQDVLANAIHHSVRKAHVEEISRRNKKREAALDDLRKRLADIKTDAAQLHEAMERLHGLYMPSAR